MSHVPFGGYFPPPTDLLSHSVHAGDTANANNGVRAPQYYNNTCRGESPEDSGQEVGEVQSSNSKP